MKTQSDYDDIIAARATAYTEMRRKERRQAFKWLAMFLAAIIGIPALVLVIDAITAPADAMTYSYRSVGQKIVIDAVGEITPNESALLANWILSLPPAMLHTSVAAVVFDSPGGNVLEAKRLALSIRNMPDHPNTGVAAGGMCASACVLLWAAGEHKSVASNAVIGVHRTSMPTDAVKADPDGTRMVANDLNVMIANDLASVCAPPNVVAAQITTPGDSLYVLTRADYAAWNVNVTSSPEPTPDRAGTAGLAGGRDGNGR
jgi:hypothetical protein